MIKLLVLCLLATLVTGKETEPKSSEAPHASPTTGVEKSTEDTHPPTQPALHPNTTDTKESLEDSHPPTHSIPHPSTVTHGEPTSKNTSHTGLPTAPLTCNCTDCHEHHCTTEPSKRFCVTTAEENTLDGIRSVGVKRTCGDNIHLCNEKISITLSEHVYWRSHTTCCNDTDGCNSRSLGPPPADSSQDKLVCPSCFAVNNSNCTLIDRKCAATENKCINVTGTIENGNSSHTFSGQGCATSSATSINGTTLVFGNAAYHFARITMTDAKDGASQTLRGVPFTVLLSSFVGLLQAKFIY